LSKKEHEVWDNATLTKKVNELEARIKKLEK